MSSDFESMKADFVKQLEGLNYSKKTVDAYRGHLEWFFKYLKSRGLSDLRAVGKSVLMDYVQMIQVKQCERGKGYKPNTIAIKVRAVKRFFEWMETKGYVLMNPSDFLKEPKVEKRLPGKALTIEEMDRVLDQPDLTKATGIRDRAILEVFYSTGVRLFELMGMKINDVDLKSGTVFVRQGKFKKDRVVPLGDHAIRYLKTYLEKVRPRLQFLSIDVYQDFWLGSEGRPLTPIRIQQLVRLYGRKAKLSKDIGPHVLRHTFATQMIKQGADMVSVAMILGHTSLAVTKRYTSVTEMELKQVHQARHPREKEREADQLPVIKKMHNRRQNHEI